jgi:hypothetical protein
MNVIRQATLIAKSGLSAGLIGLCCEKIAEAIGKQFSPYEMAQIHATVVGLERTAGSASCNLNYQRYRGESVEMDLPGFFNYLSSDAPLPFSIQIGGFANRDYPFTSRGHRPYDRSFSIQGDKAVVMGWPRIGRPSMQLPTAAIAKTEEGWLYPRTLDEIRLTAEEYGILHS